MISLTLSGVVKIEQKKIQCEDGYLLKAHFFFPEEANENHKVLVINSATAVGQGLYRNYAIFMAENGFHVVTYDYRGIAASRPKKLRGFKASFTDWGRKDVGSVLEFVKSNYPNNALVVLGHSIGGTLMGMTPKSQLAVGLLNIGAQTAYYKDWSTGKAKLYFLWHLLFPGFTRMIGYFPGKALGILEDVPKGVVEQWHARRKNSDMAEQLRENGIEVHYEKYKGKLLTLAISDDPIGTKPALSRIHNLFENAQKNWETVCPEDIGVSEIGHFGFFSRKFKGTLWKKTRDWFETI